MVSDTDYKKYQNELKLCTLHHLDLHYYKHYSKEYKFHFHCPQQCFKKGIIILIHYKINYKTIIFSKTGYFVVFTKFYNFQLSPFESCMHSMFYTHSYNIKEPLHCIFYSKYNQDNSNNISYLKTVGSIVPGCWIPRCLTTSSSSAFTVDVQF